MQLVSTKCPVDFEHAGNLFLSLTSSRAKSCCKHHSPFFEELLILMDKMMQLPVLRRQGVKLVDIELPELFDIQRSAFTVRLVVELGVIFVHLSRLWVVVTVTTSQLPPSRSHTLSFPRHVERRLHGQECTRNRRDMTHAAISSAPNSFLHFSLFAHINLAFGRSNFRARRNRNKVMSSYRSYPSVCTDADGFWGARPSAMSSFRNSASADSCAWSLCVSERYREASRMDIDGRDVRWRSLQVTWMAGEGIFGCLRCQRART